eukprot:9070856-Pyramimonas_sp.AAC.1
MTKRGDKEGKTQSGCGLGRAIAASRRSTNRSTDGDGPQHDQEWSGRARFPRGPVLTHFRLPSDDGSEGSASRAVGSSAPRRIGRLSQLS